VDILCKLANKLRDSQKVMVDYNKKGLKSHLKSADKALAKEIYFIGGDELANGTIWIKNLENKEERVVSIDSL
jgi:histidyl-tRNA synthetase